MRQDDVDRCIVGTQIIADGTVTVLGCRGPPTSPPIGYVTQDPTI